MVTSIFSACDIGDTYLHSLVTTNELVFISVILDPLLLEMTVQDLEFKLMAATDRISCLEGQVQQLTQQQWQLTHQLQTIQQQQQVYGWGNTSLNDSQSEQRDWLWSNHQASNLHTPMCQEAYEHEQGNMSHNLSPCSKAGKLAVKLAREAYFGEDVLSRCTVNGFREHPALPIAELNEQTMLMQFPKYWNSVQEFESLWLICSDAIGQAANIQLPPHSVQSL